MNVLQKEIYVNCEDVRTAVNVEIQDEKRLAPSHTKMKHKLEWDI